MPYRFPGSPAITTGNRNALLQLNWMSNTALLFDRLNRLLSLLFYDGEGDTKATYAVAGMVAGETSTPSLRVQISQGLGFYMYVPMLLLLDDAPDDPFVVSQEFVPPATGFRWDTIGINPETYAIVYATGTPGDNTPPTLTEPAFPVANIYHRADEESILDTDDSTNGYIVDIRPLVE